MKYEIEKDTLILRPEGDVDIITADAFKAECIELIAAHSLPVLFDCSKVDFIDSTGLGAFVAIQKAAAGKNVSVSLIHLKPTIKKLFVITKLDEVMAVGE